MTSRAPINEPLIALALHTAGWPIKAEYTDHIKTDRRHLTFWIEKDPLGATTIVRKFRDPRPAKNLQTTDPAHPFLAAHHALEAVQTLNHWLTGRLSQPPAIVRTPGPLLRCIPSASSAHDLQMHVWPALNPAYRVNCLRFAAALIVCGFPCYPKILSADGTQPPGLAFPAESLTFPGLTHDLLARHLQPSLASDPLPGHTLGEHPFDYAHMAALNSSSLPALLNDAAKNPTKFIKGRGTGGVIARASLFDSPNSSFRDRAHQFLT